MRRKYALSTNCGIFVRQIVAGSCGYARILMRSMTTATAVMVNK